MCVGGGGGGGGRGQEGEREEVCVCVSGHALAVICKRETGGRNFTTFVNELILLMRETLTLSLSLSETANRHLIFPSVKHRVETNTSAIFITTSCISPPPPPIHM